MCYQEHYYYDSVAHAVDRKFDRARDQPTCGLNSGIQTVVGNLDLRTKADDGSAMVQVYVLKTDARFSDHHVHHQQQLNHTSGTIHLTDDDIRNQRLCERELGKKNNKKKTAENWLNLVQVISSRYI